MYHIIHQIKELSYNQRVTILLIIIMSTQFVAIEGFVTSPIKVSVMIFCFFFFFWKVPYISKAVWCSILYWTICFCIALLHEYFRFSTIAYLGMFLMAYIVYYHLIFMDTFSLHQFKKILSYIIYAYCIILLLQQISIIIGIRNLGILNLADNYLLSINNSYYDWNRLPSLSCEPSHSAKIIITIMFGYIRCLEVEKGAKISLTELFNKKNKWVSICFLWMIFMMGSGTGWIGFGILCIYFIHWRTFLYTIPILIGSFFILQYSGNKQFERAIITIQATMTGNIQTINEADGSSSTRVIPILNTFIYSDLTKTESWIGKGTLSEKESLLSWMNYERKIPVVEQYGFVGFFFSLLLIYTCAIKKFWSIETILFFILSLATLGNEYHIWSQMYIFTAIRYFQIKKEHGCLDNHSEL